MSLCRLHVEEAEDKLVQSTETAIGLMKSVLENVSGASIQQQLEHANVMFSPLCTTIETERVLRDFSPRRYSPSLHTARAFAKSLVPGQSTTHLLLHRS